MTMAEQWTAVLARMGTPTGDGRILTPGGITNRDLPLPLMWQRRTEDGHGGAVIVGRIEEMSFTDDRVIATGTLLDVPEAAEARTLIESGVIGPSVDLDDLNYVMDDEERIIVTDARIAGATLVPIPAFADVSIAMAAEGTMSLATDVPEMIIASAVELPPLEFFQNPHLEGPTPLTIGENGRVFGHIATWGTCHVGLPGCVTPPPSPSDYAYFLTGAERTKDGVTVPVGKLTIGGGHAAPNDGFVAAAEHYDNVGTAVASVFAGEDEHGIWVSGYVVPGTTHESVSALARSPISGDWRRIGGNLELIAAHAVNVPGFPVPRAKVRFANDVQESLVGQFAPLREQPKPVQPKSTGPSPADLAKMAQRKQADAARAKLTWALKRGR
jgi:hypothetical protein